MNKKPSIYLASPYSHADKKVREERYRKVMLATASLLRGGYNVYSPIVYSHQFVVSGEVDHVGYDFWQDKDEFEISARDQLWVLRLDGWDKSEGIKKEIECAMSLEKYVFIVSFNIDMQPNFFDLTGGFVSPSPKRKHGLDR